MKLWSTLHYDTAFFDNLAVITGVRMKHLYRYDYNPIGTYIDNELASAVPNVKALRYPCNILYRSFLLHEKEGYEFDVDSLGYQLRKYIADNYDYFIKENYNVNQILLEFIKKRTTELKRSVITDFKLFRNFFFKIYKPMVKFYFAREDIPFHFDNVMELYYHLAEAYQSEFFIDNMHFNTNVHIREITDKIKVLQYFYKLLTTDNSLYFFIINIADQSLTMYNLTMYLYGEYISRPPLAFFNYVINEKEV